MASIAKTPSGTRKAVIRKRGWPTTTKTFRTKRDAQDWAKQCGEIDRLSLWDKLYSHR